MIHTRLKSLLGELGLSQRQFAQQLNLDPGYLSRILNGKADPPERILLLIENVFDVEGLWLRTGEGDKLKKDALTPLERELLNTVDSLDEKDAKAVLDFAHFIREKHLKYDR